MESLFIVDNQPAGVNPIQIELYSEQFMEQTTKEQLTRYFKKALIHEKNNKVLIIGGRCGATAQILAPFCQQIDIIEEEPYVNFLRNSFIDRKEVTYRFNREGLIGEDFTWKPIQNENCKFDVFTLQRFHKTEDQDRHYHLILLQHVLVQKGINIIRQLMLVSHDVLFTMIVPGKLHHIGLFQLLSGIEKNILLVFYQNEFHERLKYTRHITGRRQQYLYWQIFVWKKKRGGEQGSSKDLENIVQLVEEQVKVNQIQHEKPPVKGTDLYETQQLVQMYRVFHFESEEMFGVPNYPHACAQLCIQTAEKCGLKGRALDLGCAVGRTTFDMAEYFDEVVGVDISNAFIKFANQQLKQKYNKCQGKVRFEVGDACKLDQSLGKFNLIFGGNLLDRLHDPREFLRHIKQFLEPKGVLILSSPYTWLEEYTPKDKWVGGLYHQNRAVSTTEGLVKMLSPEGFKQIKGNDDVRFVIKENNWVYQYTLASVTYWQKND